MTGTAKSIWRSVAIVIPVFNDWASLSQLVRDIDNCSVPAEMRFSLFVINDGSTLPAEFDCPLSQLRRITEIHLINLVCNLGHQRAIAVGLVEAYRRGRFDFVVVMDSDGEDRPADIHRLLMESKRLPEHIICAQRKRRPGNLIFSIWYEGYKLAFKVFTGVSISFGNFCLIPYERVETLINNSFIWNNLASALTRSRIPLSPLPSDRGRRYAGKSKMNFVSLVMHGLSAIAVYSDIVMVRLMLFAIILGLGTLFGICAVVAVKLFTELAIPGWASSVAGLLIVILLQAIMLFSISAFSILNARSVKLFNPRFDAQSFILSRRELLTTPILSEVAE